MSIVRDEPDGVWVAGLPEVSTLITVGQELVVPGEVVEVDFEASGEMPARAPVETPVEGDDMSKRGSGDIATSSLKLNAAAP